MTQELKVALELAVLQDIADRNSLSFNTRLIRTRKRVLWDILVHAKIYNPIATFYLQFLSIILNYFFFLNFLE